jgi:hypothetical protein
MSEFMSTRSVTRARRPAGSPRHPEFGPHPLRVFAQRLGIAADEPTALCRRQLVLGTDGGLREIEQLCEGRRAVHAENSRRRR